MSTSVTQEGGHESQWLQTAFLHFALHLSTDFETWMDRTSNKQASLIVLYKAAAHTAEVTNHSGTTGKPFIATIVLYLIRCFPLLEIKMF